MSRDAPHLGPMLPALVFLVVLPVTLVVGAHAFASATCVLLGIPAAG